MVYIPVSEAGSRLDEIADQFAPGEEIVLARGGDTVARLIRNGTPEQERRFGLGKGKLTVVADDDEHLEHFQDYMP